MTTFKFVPDVDVKAIARTPEMVNHFGGVADLTAEAVRAAWEASGPHPHETGDYIESINGDSGIENGVAAGRVNADDYKAWWLEVGTEDTPPFAPLRRGVDAVGLHLIGNQARGLYG